LALVEQAAVQAVHPHFLWLRQLTVHPLFRQEVGRRAQRRSLFFILVGTIQRAQHIVLMEGVLALSVTALLAVLQFGAALVAAVM
jgi:hypothetical protein